MRQVFVLLYPNEYTKLIGPFDDVEHARLFGRAWQENEGDNPCWTLMDLDGARELLVEHCLYGQASVKPNDMNKPPIVTDEGLHKDAERQREGVTGFKDAHRRAYDAQTKKD